MLQDYALKFARVNAYKILLKSAYLGNRKR